MKLAALITGDFVPTVFLSTLLKQVTAAKEVVHVAYLHCIFTLHSPCCFFVKSNSEFRPFSSPVSGSISIVLGRRDLSMNGRHYFVQFYQFKGSEWKFIFVEILIILDINYYDNNENNEHQKKYSQTNCNADHAAAFPFTISWNLRKHRTISKTISHHIRI